MRLLTVLSILYLQALPFAWGSSGNARPTHATNLNAACQLPLITLPDPLLGRPGCESRAWNGEVQDPAVITRRDLVENNGYETGRGLQDIYITRGTEGSVLPGYFNLLGAEFEQHLRQLREKDCWIDSGAGQAVALRQYLSDVHGLARIAGITAVVPEEDTLRNRNWMLNCYADQFVYEKAYIDNGELSSLDTPEGCRAYIARICNGANVQPRMITDVYGPLTYTATPDLVMQRYFNMLAKGGKVYLHTRANEQVQPPRIKAPAMEQVGKSFRQVSPARLESQDLWEWLAKASSAGMLEAYGFRVSKVHTTPGGPLRRIVPEGYTSFVFEKTKNTASFPPLTHVAENMNFAFTP